MTNTEIFDELMRGYGVAAEEVGKIAGKHEHLAMATMRSHSAGFIRVMVAVLQPDPAKSKFADNITAL